MKTKKPRSFQTKMLFLVGLGVVVFALFLVVASFAKEEDKPSLAEPTLTKSGMKFRQADIRRGHAGSMCAYVQDYFWEYRQRIPHSEARACRSSLR